VPIIIRLYKGFWLLWNNNESINLSAGVGDLSLHYAQLTADSAKSNATNSGSDNCQYGYCNRGIGRSAPKTILGAFLLVFGAALMKLAFYFGNTMARTG
jgi:hypothetical protein